jgi:transposase-like protein
MDYDNWCCPNGACRDHGRYGLGNITLKERYGRGGRLRCSFCAGPAERQGLLREQGQPFFKLRISYEQLYQILTILVQCGSVRGTAKASGVSVNTVLRIIRIAGAHARGFSSTTSCFRGSG